MVPTYKQKLQLELGQSWVKMMAEKEPRIWTPSIDHFHMYTQTGLHSKTDSGGEGSHRMSASQTGIMTKTYDTSSYVP